MIDWTISIGNILTVISFLAGFGWFIIALRARMDIVEHDLATMRDTLKDVSKSIIEGARASVRLDEMEKRMNLLSGRINGCLKKTI